MSMTYIHPPAPELTLKLPLNRDLQQAISDLRKKAADFYGPNAVSCKIFFNGDEFQVDVSYRTADDLRRSGISMRNLAGDFIKEES
tara:strand:- start:610 stop:867 length:258 start_codon:yes stop_codon:yes gene_type:complete